MSTHFSAVFVVAGRYVQCLDRAGGRPIWQRKLPTSMWGSGFATIMVDGNEVFVGRNGYVYCLDGATGAVIWERGVGSSNDLVIVATRGAQGGSLAGAVAQQQAAATAATAAAVSATIAASS